MPQADTVRPSDCSSHPTQSHKKQLKFCPNNT